MLLLAHLSLFFSLVLSGVSQCLALPFMTLIFGISLSKARLHWRRIQLRQEIVVSAAGEIVLRTIDGPGNATQGHSVCLSSKSRIWPNFLSIFLLDEFGKEYKLLILPDSLSPEAFRALKVSLMWIAQHPAR